ncbi:hypothetical protein SAMN02746041_03271 [Desulfacinum hydrothermale DSM 13146]|uniref:Uncharacterized protein n=1 Tax=Desulfacinum hydrothermale DSM 13146 TaxID=1121390 RepID=A0A1W1XX49_9BACT|nr:hypothetical protein [Desulfacinum hydrothermale]SMC28506.1 hypothetical protein SAMN02746041_03271 [Desulfacinum hydrothermale DSM 13146]
MARLATDVKVFRYTDPGAPELTGANGSMVELLNACLVTGYGSTTVTSVTREGSTVTVTIQGGHSFPQYAVIELAGANETDYNGTHRIETVTDTTFTFTLPDGLTPTTPATGTIAVKMASAGWEQTFASADNLRRVFRSTDPAAFGYYLYVDDTESEFSNRAAVKGYGIVEDIDTRFEPFPWSDTDDQWTWWVKSYEDATPRPWAVIADSRLFYVWVNADPAQNKPFIYVFGDAVPINSADLFACVIGGHGSSTETNYSGGLLTITALDNMAPGGYLARDITGTQFGVGCCVVGTDLRAHNAYYARDIYPRPLGLYDDITFPCPVTNSILTNSVPIFEYASNAGVPRGYLPGLYEPLHDKPLDSLVIIQNDIPGHRPLIGLRYLASRWNFSGGETGLREGQVLVDILGSWRD